MENWLRNPQYVLEAWHSLTEKPDFCIVRWVGTLAWQHWPSTWQQFATACYLNHPWLSFLRTSQEGLQRWALGRLRHGRHESVWKHPGSLSHATLQQASHIIGQLHKAARMSAALVGGATLGESQSDCNPWCRSWVAKVQRCRMIQIQIDPEWWRSAHPTSVNSVNR